MEGLSHDQKVQEIAAICIYISFSFLCRIRALAHGSSTSTCQPPPPNLTAAPKYSLAQYRYGREEMLALIPKDPKKPDCLLKDTSKIVKDTFAMPLALTPHTEDEQVST